MTDVKTERSLIKSGFYYRCQVCEKPHRRTSVFHINGKMKYSCLYFCSENCIAAIGVKARRVVLQTYNDKMKGMRKALAKYGDWFARRKGYREYVIDQHGNVVPIYHYAIEDENSIDNLTEFLNAYDMQDVKVFPNDNTEEMKDK